MNLLYLDFIRYSIGAAEYDDSHFRNMDWQGLFNFGMKQSLLGVLLAGIKRLKSTDGINPHILLKFITVAHKTKCLNISINNTALKLGKELDDAGFIHCILKGPGLASLYPDPLARIPGDIDMWTANVKDARNRRGLSTAKSRKRVIEYVKRKFPDAEVAYYHIDYPVFKDVAVELHFMPVRMVRYWHNRRLQRWLDTVAERQFSHVVTLAGAGDAAVVTSEFNVVYLLAHILRHLTSEGVGMRQLMDYYYLLMNLDIRSGEYTELLHRFGLMKIAGAVMWVLGDVLMLPRERMIAVPNEKRGRRLLDVVIHGGNFGFYNDKIDRRRGHVVRCYLDKLGYRCGLLRDYPEEVLWTYIFTFWQKLWKLWKGY